MSSAKLLPSKCLCPAIHVRIASASAHEDALNGFFEPFPYQNISKPYQNLSQIMANTPALHVRTLASALNTSHHDTSKPLLHSPHQEPDSCTGRCPSQDSSFEGNCCIAASSMAPQSSYLV